MHLTTIQFFVHEDWFPTTTTTTTLQITKLGDEPFQSHSQLLEADM